MRLFLHISALQTDHGFCSTGAEGLRQFAQAHPAVQIYVFGPVYDNRFPVQPGHWIISDGSDPSLVLHGATGNDSLVSASETDLSHWMEAGGRGILAITRKDASQLAVLWPGRTVIMDDSPELVCAELSEHMGLPYSLGGVHLAHFKPPVTPSIYRDVMSGPDNELAPEHMLVPIEVDAPGQCAMMIPVYKLRAALEPGEAWHDFAAPLPYDRFLNLCETLYCGAERAPAGTVSIRTEQGIIRRTFYSRKSMNSTVKLLRETGLQFTMDETGLDSLITDAKHRADKGGPMCGEHER